MSANVLDMNDQPPKLDQLADLLGTTREHATQHVLDAAERYIFPKKLNRHYLLPDIDVADSGREPDGTAYLTLTNGLHFYGPVSRQRAAFHRIMRPHLHTRIDPDAYGLAIEVNHRYRRAFSYRHFPDDNGVVVEAGAKRGYQALGFGQRVGADGHVIAVEMAEADYPFLTRTFTANNGLCRLTPVYAALWSDDDEDLSYAGAIQAVDHTGKFGESAGTCRSMTLRRILDDLDVSGVDFLNIMVNGAELEVLKGLGHRLDDIKMIRIASYYSDDYGDLAGQCARYLEARGGRALSVQFPGSSWLVPRPFVDDV